VSVLLFSCTRNAKDSEFLIVPVDIDSDVSLPLSTISEEIKAIELELTDESLINPDRIQQFHFLDDHIILYELDKILVFDMNGKFVRTIGSKGQGPGEYTRIEKFAVDEKTKRLIIVNSPRIICYDLSGNFLFQSNFFFETGSKVVFDLIRLNDDMFIMADQFVGMNERGADAPGTFSQPKLYKVDDNFRITDSITYRKTFYESLMFYAHIWNNLILNSNSNSYVYFPDYMGGKKKASEPSLQDTLYRFEKNKLIPDIKLQFKNDGISGSEKIIELGGIYRSTRFVFAVYINKSGGAGLFRFCYDIKTKMGYNMKSGFTDDINQIEKRINIRPFNSNTEMFYYWHTHMKPDDRDEPNPTLYIGKLKK